MFKVPSPNGKTGLCYIFKVPSPNGKTGLCPAMFVLLE